MATATILETRFNVNNGDWPAGYGGGWWLLDPAGVPSTVLPAGVSSVAPKDALVVRQEADPSAPWWLQTSTGIRTPYARGRAGAPLRMDVVVAGSTPVNVAAYFRDSGGFPASFEILSDDLAVSYASYTNAATPGQGTWHLCRLSGPGGFTLRWNSNNIRLYGLIFGATTSSYSDPARGGIAVGGGWPASLAIPGVGLGGIAVGVGEGMDPTATRVEAGLGGIAVGGGWPASLAIGDEAFAGLAVGTGGWGAPPPDPDAALPIASEASCLAAIRAALDDTREFDAVWSGTARDPRGRPGDLSVSVAVDPGRVSAETLGDDGPDGLTIYTATATLRLVVRADDDELRDGEAMRLTAVVRNALNGRKLARNCWPDWSLVSGWSTLPARDAERAVSATITYRWHEDGWASADAT